MYDGDLLFTTNNEVMLRNQTNLPALNCIQYNAKKCIVGENDVIESNLKGFGSKIGAITNRITEMTAMMANFAHDSEEYKILEYRTQCGQAQQQAEIDAAKGIISNPMPKSWYIWKENCIEDGDSDDIIQKKRLYQRVCAHKKPYFFQYNYAYLRSDYLKYQKQSNENALSLFGKNVDDLLSSNELTDEEQKFITIYKNGLPLDFSPSTMNKICWFVEKVFDSAPNVHDCEFDYSILKSNVGYSLQEYSNIKKLCKDYKTDCLSAIKKSISEHENVDSDQIMEYLRQSIDECVPNADIQCDIMVDLCYKDGLSKHLVWEICGDTIFKNVLNKNDGVLKYPKKCDNGEFECCGSRFSMETYTTRGDEDEEF